MVADIEKVDLHSIGSQALLTVSGSMVSEGEGYVECKLLVKGGIIAVPHTQGISFKICYIKNHIFCPVTIVSPLKRFLKS